MDDRFSSYTLLAKTSYNSLEVGAACRVAGIVKSKPITHLKLLPPRPPDNGIWNENVLFIRELDRKRESFPWSHGQITGEAPT